MFRFEPRYKLRSNGDLIVVEDLVILKSSKQSLIIHVSPAAISFSGSKARQLIEITASQVSVMFVQSCDEYTQVIVAL